MLTEKSVKIRDEYCSRCIICSSVCPFEAIYLNREAGEVILDIEKCQVCGICFSACPSSSIDIAYYKVALLSKYVEKMRKNNLLLMCRGAIIKPELKESLKKNGVLDDSAQLHVPCVGRIPPEFLLKTIEAGVKKILIVPCEDDKCRFKVGSDINVSRLVLLQKLLSQIGLDYNALSFVRSSIKAYINKYRCIGCGNCAYTCPNRAIKIVSPGVAQLNEAACSGCGACVSVCPSLAINLEGFENNLILETISKYRPLISEVKIRSGSPVVAVFYCHWANFPAPDEYRAHIKESIVFFEIPCSSMISPLYILQAFYEGFDGVLVVACKKGECKFERGNELAERHIVALKNLLRQVNLENRLEICFVSPKYLGEIDNQIKLFMDRIASLIEGSR
ncbi:MAG: hydrogenase iron-sulfur subunit [Candidatus Bathyarchaeia archaeon]